jgi:hypothetical protein
MKAAKAASRMRWRLSLGSRERSKDVAEGDRSRLFRFVGNRHYRKSESTSRTVAVRSSPVKNCAARVRCTQLRRQGEREALGNTPAPFREYPSLGGGYMIVEMRTYRLKPGMRTAFLEVFRSKSVPEHLKLGMKICGPFLSVEEPDVFFFMRGFPDEASRGPLKARFFEGELWKRELENILMPMIDRYEAVVVEVPADEFGWIDLASHA